MPPGIINIISPPSKETAFLVKKYLLLKTPPGLREKITDKHIPDGSASVVFNFSGNTCFADHSGPLPPWFLTCPRIAPVKLVTTPPAETFVIVCKTSVLSRLFRLSLVQPESAFYLNAENIFGKPLWEKMKEETVHEKRIRIFEEYLRRYTRGEKYSPDKIDEACEKIYAGNGLLTIEQLARQIKLNVRSLRRHFKKRTGLCPKSFCRIVRFNYLLRSVAEGGRVDFQRLAFMGDFFDQAHFIHDFEKITGESPGAFFGRDLENVKLLSGFEKSPE